MPDNRAALAEASLKKALKPRPKANGSEINEALIAWLHEKSPLGRAQFDGQSELGKALWTLRALSVDLGAGGTTEFLQSMGSEARRLGDYAKMIGAPTTEAYAADMLKEVRRLNGRQLPAETRGAMQEAIGRWEEKDMNAGGTGLFEALDERYTGPVMEEIEDRLPAFARANVAEIVRACIEYLPPAPAMIPATAKGKDGRRYFSADPRDYHERVAAWSRRVSELPGSGWAIVAKRYNDAAARRADRKVFRVWSDGPRVGFTEKEWRSVFRELRHGCIPDEKRACTTIAASELSKPAQRKAARALEFAYRMLFHLPELDRLPDGPQLIATLLGPFDEVMPAWDAKKF